MFKQLATLGLVASLSQAVKIDRKNNNLSVSIEEAECYADWDRRWDNQEDAEACCSSGGFGTAWYNGDGGYGCVSFGGLTMP